MDKEYRLLAVLQTFTIILTIKSISASYFATQYAMENRMDLVVHYAKIMNIIAICLFISLILFALPLVVKMKKKTKRIYDWSALGVVVIVLFTLFIYN